VGGFVFFLCEDNPYMPVILQARSKKENIKISHRIGKRSESQNAATKGYLYVTTSKKKKRGEKIEKKWFFPLLLPIW